MFDSGVRVCFVTYAPVSTDEAIVKFLNELRVYGSTGSSNRGFSRHVFVL